MRRRVAPVDRVGVDERAAVLGKRSIKAESQQAAIRMAVSMVDLTTLEGQDTPGKVVQLAAKAVCPAPTHPEMPSVAALCVYPARVADAKRALNGSGVAVASVATGFPSGLTSMELKLEETRQAVEAGAEGIEMVIPPDAYLAGVHQLVLVKETLGDEWLTPDRFRIGASSLLNDLLMQYEHGASGRYQRPEDFSKEGGDDRLAHAP